MEEEQQQVEEAIHLPPPAAEGVKEGGRKGWRKEDKKVGVGTACGEK